jgi:hypothetical protein
VEWLIDDEGHAWLPGDNVIDHAVRHLGFIHIRKVGRSIVVSLCPTLVQPITMTGAFYEIANLDPERTFVCSDGPKLYQVFRGYRPALHEIYRLVAATGSVKPYPMVPQTSALPPQL